MKKLRILISFILIFSIITISPAIFTKDIHTAQAATTISISDKTLTLELGRYKTLKIYGTTRNVSWHSSNNWVATVTNGGKVTAKAVGTATITATVNGKKLTCKVNVLRIKKKAVTMAIGSTSTLIVTGTKSPIVWSTSDPTITSVSNSGEVTANAPGIAIITASVDGKELTSKITVVDLNYREAVMELGGFSGYTKTLKINDTTGKITWSSGDTSVATVSSDGIVSAKGAGSTTITATVDGVELTCQIKVLAENIRAFTLKMGETKTLEIYGTDSEVIWHSNKKSVALVTDDGTVSTVAPGSAIIMAYVDGRIIKSRVTVVE